MELLSPAGTLEKLRIAYRYGADAAYAGVRGFSLRSAADAIVPDTAEVIEERARELRELKLLDGRPRKLYAAINLFAHEHDLAGLPQVLETIAALPIDALIVADIGLIDQIRSVLPEIELHLSTQANCTNSGAAKLYHRLGFSRIVAARELSLDEIRAIKDAVPELEIEVFAHGAMCMSYSGRCFLSSEMVGRSANLGDCAHSCRWNYALTEEKRPGEYYPIEEDGRFSTILSSRDLMLYNRIGELIDAGVSSIKIEGRMKSALYAAVTAGAYRSAIDRKHETADSWMSLLFSLSHREYTEGFLFGDEQIHQPSSGVGPASLRLMGILRGAHPEGYGRWHVEAKNAMYKTAGLSLITPDGAFYRSPAIELFDANGQPTDRIVHRQEGSIRFPDISDATLVDAILVLPRDGQAAQR